MKYWTMDERIILRDTMYIGEQLENKINQLRELLKDDVNDESTDEAALPAIDMAIQMHGLRRVPIGSFATSEQSCLLSSSSNYLSNSWPCENNPSQSSLPSNGSVEVNSDHEDTHEQSTPKQPRLSANVVDENQALFNDLVNEALSSKGLRMPHPR